MNIDDPTVLKRWRLVGAFYFCASRRPFFSKGSGSSVIDQVSNSTQVLPLYLISGSSSRRNEVLRLGGTTTKEHTHARRTFNVLFWKV